MIKLKTLLPEIVTNTPPAHVQPATNQALSTNFVNYIKSVENSVKSGYNPTKKLWFPYKDSAGWNVGYGHKIKSTSELNNLKNGVPQEYVDKLLQQDLQHAERIVQKYIVSTYKTNILLTSPQKEMLTDFAYNLGTLHSFPKFVYAVLKNDVDGMRKEYKRSAAGKELTGRNAAFYDRYLK